MAFAAPVLTEHAPAATQRRRMPNLHCDERGTAAIEFAFVAPFLIVCLLAGFEITKYISALRRIGYISNSIAEEISQNTSGTILPADINFYNDSAMLLFPGVLADAQRKGVNWYNDIVITMSGVNFTTVPVGCTSACTYIPTIAWSAGVNGLTTWRSCLIPPVQATNTAPPSLLKLPVDSYGSGYLIVVDVVYTYTPFVATKIFNPMTIRRSFYIQPRYVPMIKFKGTSSIGSYCLGYAAP